MRRTTSSAGRRALLLAALALSPPLAPALDLSFHQEASTFGPARFEFLGSTEGIDIRHEHAGFGCCLSFGATVEVEGSVLRVTEEDRGPPCLCPVEPWAVAVSIRGLEPGAHPIYLRSTSGELLATAEVAVPATRTATFVRGAVNDDAAVDISDAVAALGYLYLGERGPSCLDAADVNDDGAVDVSDPVYLLGHLFLGGPAPPEPFASAGEDPTADATVCDLAQRVVAADFVRDGDFNGDGRNDLTDGISFLSFLELGGAPPVCEDAVDVDDDGVLDLDDLCGLCPSCCPYLWLGPPIVDAECGPDPTPDRLGCGAPGCERGG